MASASFFTVTMPQSEANSSDRESLQQLLQRFDKLTHVDCTHRFSGGYSSCRVYLALAEVQGNAARLPWILKLGSKEELDPENERLAYAKTQVRPENIASKIEYITDGSNAVLILDYANYQGRAPIDLDTALARVEAQELFSAVVNVTENWISTPTWKNSNVSQTLKGWTAPRLAKLPDTILQSKHAPSIYSPDFGEAYSNPAFHLTRDLRRLEARAPYAFTHGDLNLRNVLFARGTDGSVQHNPIFIDFRHAGTDQYAIVDLAKLEACLRYQRLPSIIDQSTLSQTTAFLSATRRDIRLSALPDVCTDKWLQDTFRCLRPVRDAAARCLGLPASAPANAGLVYWATLIVYAMSAATYPQLPLEIRTLAYLDAAALFTQHIQERSTGDQFVLPAHGAHSPPVVLAPATPPPPPDNGLFFQTITRGQAILVIGGGYGRLREVFGSRTAPSISPAPLQADHESGSSRRIGESAP